MAKNTRNTAFRKIDVDEYNEDNYKEDEPVDPHSPMSGPDENEITSLVNQGKQIEALKNCLRNAPTGSKSQQIKDNALNITLRVLLAIKSSQIEEAVSNLDTDQIDTLMKYVYRGFESPVEGSSAHLLLWHDRVFAVGGIGSITRVLTDRERV